MRLWAVAAGGAIAFLLLCAGYLAADVPGGGESAVAAWGDPVSPASSHVPCLPGSGGDLKTDAKSPLVVTIDTSKFRQTIRGFGASDAWSIQYVGQWPDAEREAIADLLFDTGLVDDVRVHDRVVEP